MPPIRTIALHSYLDWNRASGRELNHFREMGAEKHLDHQASVRKYAREMGLRDTSPEYEFLLSDECFLALYDGSTHELNGEIRASEIDGAPDIFLTTKQLADRYAICPNRAYVFLTEIDGTLESIIYAELKEVRKMCGLALDVSAPGLGVRTNDKFELFRRFFWFRRSNAQRADVPFLLLCSAKGYVRIPNTQDQFEKHFLRTIFKILADEFEPISGPASRGQLKKIARRIGKLNNDPASETTQRKTTIRVHWRWIAAAVSLLAGLTAILANYDAATAKVCGFFETRIEICASEVFRPD
ncbi:hypothetical protein [Hyphomonas sp.]|uniref:hypothetical protein n=1 Tax=Hyphomonas sp. TaxID=87 RepID=UPI003D2E5B9C